MMVRTKVESKLRKAKVDNQEQPNLIGSNPLTKYGSM